MSSMSVRTFISVAPKLPASISLLLRGPHGIGKSMLGRQIAKIIKQLEKLDEFEVIDRRLSQQSEGDIIGLPSTDGEVTRFNPPDWYKRACKKPCFLFLDELNRATPEVMQAAFQIVLDRELNGWKLHPQTRVMSAINSSAAYNVNEVDPALLDRFWVIDLTPDVKDWLTWGRATYEPTSPVNAEEQRVKELNGGYNCAPIVVDFIASEEKWLDPPKDAEPAKVHSSRRSWERLGDALAYAGVLDQPTHELFYSICLGFVGPEASIRLCDFAKTQDTRFTGKDIVERYDEVRNKVIGRKKTDIMNDAIEKAITYIKKQDRVNDKQGNNLSKFMQDLPGELKIVLWTKLTSDGVDKLELAKSAHKYLAKHVLDVFGVPMGEAGIGVVPDVPGIMKKTPEKSK